MRQKIKFWLKKCLQFLLLSLYLLVVMIMIIAFIHLNGWLNMIFITYELLFFGYQSIKLGDKIAHELDEELWGLKPNENR